MDTKEDVNSEVDAKPDGSSMTKNSEEAQGNDGVSIKDHNLENIGSEARINDGDHTKDNGEETQENNGELVMNENSENNKDNKEVKNDGLVQTKTNHEISMKEKREHTQETMHSKSGGVQGESIGDSTENVNLENKEDLKGGNGVFQNRKQQILKVKKVDTNVFYSLQM